MNLVILDFRVRLLLRLVRSTTCGAIIYAIMLVQLSRFQDHGWISSSEALVQCLPFFTCRVQELFEGLGGSFTSPCLLLAVSIPTFEVNRMLNLLPGFVPAKACAGCDSKIVEGCESASGCLFGCGCSCIIAHCRRPSRPPLDAAKCFRGPYPIAQSCTGI